MKLCLIFAAIFISSGAPAFEVPKSFESQTDFTGSSQFWINRKTSETIGVSDEDVSSLRPAKDDFAEIKEVMSAKGQTLSTILNIKSWEIRSSAQEIRQDGSKLIWFFGSYIDSGDDLTQFAEVYEFAKVSPPHAWLLTRYKAPWSEKEIKERFEKER